MKLDVRNKADVALARRATSYLNGVKVQKCVMADEEAGVIERYETNERGHVRASKDGDGEPHPHLIREYGTVRIELPEPV